MREIKSIEKEYEHKKKSGKETRLKVKIDDFIHRIKRDFIDNAYAYLNTLTMEKDTIHKHKTSAQEAIDFITSKRKLNQEQSQNEPINDITRQILEVETEIHLTIQEICRKIKCNININQLNESTAQFSLND